MKRKREKNHSLSPPRRVEQVEKTMNSMRGLVEAARVPYTRRLITPAKAMARINEQAKRIENALHEVHNDKRQSPQSLPTEMDRRIARNQSPVLRQVLQSQVRAFHEDARMALVCASRADRREVLFALRRTGKNGYRNRKAVWTPLSYVSCKKRG